MKKNNIFFALIFITLICRTHQVISNEPENAKFFKLENEVIHLLDGVKGCLDSNAIVDMLSVMRKIQDLKYGILNHQTKKRTGKFTYMGQHASISMLLKYEEAIEKNPAETNSKKMKDDIHRSLREARTDFIQATLYFMDKIKATKGLIMKLINESCQKRNIKQTLLLEWAGTNGNEEAYFNSKIKSFKEFDIFLTHVSDFLGDLIKSCEIGLSQFRATQAKKNATTGT